MGREVVERAESDMESWGAPGAVAAEEELPLLSLNHVSYSCRSVKESMRFYQDVLGFVLIKRPSSFSFEGAWLFNHGIGIHLIESDNLPPKKDAINPKDCHISFQCSNMDVLMQRLGEMNIEYVTAVVKDGGITVDQVFFHDPDGHMIEICNCQNIPILPLSSSCPVRLPKTIEFASPLSHLGNESLENHSAREATAQMMENLFKNMMTIFI
ncbi:hypothetical protein CDL15_Pgr003510 [Punica granatum]|uniref:VOC domain-containing protein n=1 Tax=Punica granatum TaxID=22663 RepID=A0A218X2Z4_PUNGR|nr:hypothetical protein CDL15_Pgr003510 [Punica granatum]PKI53051.1 hypothetical protein CRG98_026631 [Punica granatum]